MYLPEHFKTTDPERIATLIAHEADPALFPTL
jgi:predicted FMN-binding regulatory protein PaiB